METNRTPMRNPLLTTLNSAMIVGTVGVSSVFGLNATAHAQVDRHIQAVAITPSAGGSDSFFDISVRFSVDVEPTSAPRDASTQVLLFRNDAEVPFASLVVGVLASGGSGFCGAGDCAGTCGTGYVNGAISTLLCLDDGCPGPNCGCDCRFPSISADFPGQSVEPGDEILVILVHGPGSIPEPVSDNDSWTATFDGTPHFWQRSPRHVELVPSSTGVPGTVDVLVKGDASWNGLVGPTDLGFFVQLVNASGAVIDSVFVPGGTLPNTDPLACGGIGCGGFCGTWNGIEIDCGAFPNIWVIPCGCGANWLIPLPGVFPNEIAGGFVALVPAPGALPQLPGLEPQTLPIPSLCLADLDGDGIVNGSDLTIVLGTWGTDGAGDINNDGIVDGADLAMVLGAWGPCILI